MSAFILHEDARQSAEQMRDGDLNRGIQAIARVLSNGGGIVGMETPYKQTADYGSLANWVASSQSNWRWMVDYGLALVYEYSVRKEKSHKSLEVINWARNNVPQNVPERGQTPFPNYYQEQKPPVKLLNVIDSYRVAYVVDRMDASEDDWSRGLPVWFKGVRERISEKQKSNKDEDTDDN